LGDFWMGVELCLESLVVEKANAAHYLNLGKVYLSSGNREKAVLVFRQGLALGGNQEILQMLVEFGTRNTPVFKSLSRSNPLNKFLGFLLYRQTHRPVTPY
ncbi:MAG TPA: tetratricopeptide repeat protein, partial [Anaerolineales bacterium]|nr:tetratricopeptide repeat protein [Anaerolineales bacterium]